MISSRCWYTFHDSVSAADDLSLVVGDGARELNGSGSADANQPMPCEKARALHQASVKFRNLGFGKIQRAEARASARCPRHNAECREKHCEENPARTKPE